jgi:uncharacterized membrane protein YozB (DUF420 family)
MFFFKTEPFLGGNGFLGTRGSLMLDLVVVAMLAVLPLLGWSIYQVRVRRRYELHRQTQLLIAMTLAVAVLAFEIEMRIFGWRHRAQPSRFWRDGNWNDWIEWSLLLHLSFAIPTFCLWTWVVFRALKDFPRPVQPNSHSPQHRFWARWAAIELVFTAVTGWLFYWLAFVA